MLTYLYTYIMSHLPKSEKGQDLAEYGLLIGLIALAVVAAVIFLGDEISTVFSTIANYISTNVTGSIGN
jgi:pilus assembly protein Flp/PilA